MRLLNSPLGYGTLTKLLHWSMAGLFLFQYVAAHTMTRMGPDDRTLGLAQSVWYNWHKSIGLLALLVALARMANRRLGELPPWAETLSEAERKHLADDAGSTVDQIPGHELRLVATALEVRKLGH